MTEFFEVLPPAEARARLWEHITHRPPTEYVGAREALGRVLAEDVRSPEELPAFRRSAVDGYAVRAADTFGASDTLPAYLRVVGEVRMGQAPDVDVQTGEAVLIHTGGMLPASADAVVMVEHTQPFAEGEIEVLRPVAPGEDVIQVGEDVARGAVILPAGHRVQPQDVGALLALGLAADIPVLRRPRVHIFSTGDELVPPDTPDLQVGQIRDINGGTVGALAIQAGAEAHLGGIIRDDAEALYAALSAALPEADMLVVTAGSSVSVRDMTAATIDRLGTPGVLVHGIATRPGKPVILAAVDGKPVIGLPGNPVSAFVAFTNFGVPTIARLLGAELPRQAKVRARAAQNIPSTAGREDYVPVHLREREGELWAEPVFGKSNLIFTLVGADGLLQVPLNTTGLRQGAWADVTLF